MIRISVLLLVSASASAQSTYLLSEIPLPVHTSYVNAGGVDERGNVLLVYPEQLWVTGPDGVRQLVTNSNPFLLEAVQLADFGRVIGMMDWLPTAWDSAGIPRLLRPSPLGDMSHIASGNSADWLVGRSHTIDYDSVGAIYPVLWIGSVVCVLDKPGLSTKAWCADLNEHNRIVGGCMTPIGPNSYRTRGWIRDGLAPPQEIGLPAGQRDNVLTSINNGDEAVGWCTTDQGAVLGLRWKAGQFTTIADAGQLYWIARDGAALGLLTNAGLPVAEPTLCKGASAWRLQTLLDPISAAGWDLVQAIGIDAAGEIVCDAYDPQGNFRVCKLTPSPDDGLGRGVERKPRSREQLERVAQLLAEFSWKHDPSRMLR